VGVVSDVCIVADRGWGLTRLGNKVGAAAAVGAAAVTLGLSHNQVCLTGTLLRKTGHLHFTTGFSKQQVQGGSSSEGREVGHESFGVWGGRSPPMEVIYSGSGVETGRCTTCQIVTGPPASHPGHRCRSCHPSSGHRQGSSAPTSTPDGESGGRRSHNAGRPCRLPHRC